MTTTRENLAHLAQYYTEAVENPEAFKNWEWDWNGRWQTCEVHLGLYGGNTTFRRKPTTIEITSRGKTYTLPGPMRDRPKAGTEYWVVDVHRVEQVFWEDGSFAEDLLALDILHTTEEAAQQWCDAWAEIRGGKS